MTGDGPIDYGFYERGRGMNYWDVDPAFRRAVERTYPDGVRDVGVERLRALGERVGTTVADNADVADDNPPELHTYDREGRVVNEIEYHPAQAENERVVVESGMVADLFDAPEGADEPLPYLHGLAACYLLNYADTGLTCPVAMTQGVGLVLDAFDDAGDFADELAGIAARDDEEWVQGAMFLTEKQGGSDVGATETTARPVGRDAKAGKPGSTWKLTGEKWFCSNVDADAALALARRRDAGEGTEGLSLFVLSPSESEAAWDDASVRIRRLKEKLGTKSVPTAELELDGAPARLVGDVDAGFRQMAEMVNYERLANAMAAMGLVARALLEAKVHAASREAFGDTIDSFPLMRRDLVDLTVDHEAGLAFTFEAATHFSRYHEAGREDDEAYRLLRALVPVAKYRTARLAVEAASTAMEVLGGNGYVEEFVTERLLRDAQVLPIWEGTSNVLALDLLRAFERESAHEPVLRRVYERLDAVESDELADLESTVREATDDLGSTLFALANEDERAAQLQAKRVADRFYDVVAAAVLLSEAEADLPGDARSALVARRWIDRRLRERPLGDPERLVDDHFDAVARFASADPSDL